MNRPALSRWLLRKINGATSVDLTHIGSNDGERVIGSYPIEKGDADELYTIAGELLEDAQVETDMFDARTSFRINTRRDDGSIVGSTPVRTMPANAAANEDVPEEANRDGVTRMLMEQNRTLHRELTAMFPRMRAMHDDTYEFLGRMLKDLRGENESLRAQLHARYGEDEESAEIVAALALENDRKAALVDKVLTEGVEIVKYVAAAAAGAHASNGKSEAA